MQLMECVPNFSEGRDKTVIDSIAGVISGIDGVQIRDIDTGADVNRTVITFTGKPDPVCRAAFAAIKLASEKIDMRYHKGLHPRIGSTDVCPFIPLKDISISRAMKLVDDLARRVGEELKIPVYLYEKSTPYSHRQNISNIRRGQYERMAEKMLLSDWKPDFGPQRMNDRAGATVIGVRDLLIAFNVNFAGNVLEEAKEIVSHIRWLRESGKLVYIKVMAWYLAQRNTTQVTMNLTNYKKTALHDVYIEIGRFAKETGVRVTGSEIVGLVPENALIDAGRYYAGGKHMNRDDTIKLAVNRLKLNDLYSFDISKKILPGF